MPAAATKALHFTGNAEADRLLAADPLALLIGFALDQQVSVQKAFTGPLELKRRLGHLDAKRIARMDPSELEQAFRERPALHRFPGAMARRVQDLCSTIAEVYRGRAERVWSEASDAVDLERRLRDLPGFGDMKVRGSLAVIAKLLGVELDGWDRVLPKHPSLGDVDSPEALAEFQEKKRAHKAKLRAERN